MACYHIAYFLPKAAGGMVIAEALDFPGAVTQGYDLADARLMTASVVEELARLLINEGKPLPVPWEQAHCAEADLIELLPVSEASIFRPSVIQRDPDVLGGAPCFRGTRVPVASLVDSLQAGESLDEFLVNFPSVTREAAVSLLREMRGALSTGCEASVPDGQRILRRQTDSGEMLPEYDFAVGVRGKYYHRAVTETSEFVEDGECQDDPSSHEGNQRETGFGR